MSYFKTPAVDARRLNGRRKRVLLAPVSFYSSELRKTITAPKGFVFDGPSFPLIWGGDGEASAAIHDFMYAHPNLYTRAEADAVLCEALKAERMNSVRRAGWWLGVRIFGGNHYGKDKHANAHLFDPSPGA